MAFKTPHDHALHDYDPTPYGSRSGTPLAHFKDLPVPGQNDAKIDHEDDSEAHRVSLLLVSIYELLQRMFIDISVNCWSYP